jgi:hypothetical protein
MAVLYSLEHYAVLQGRPATAFRWTVLCFLPVFVVLVFGQASVILLALVAAAFFALRSGRDDLAGAALAVGCLKPAYIAPIVLVVLLQRRWRAFASFVVTGVALMLAVLPILGPSIFLRYVTLLRQVSSWQGHSINKPFWFQGEPMSPSAYAPQWNHSLAGLSELALPAHWSTALWVVLSVGVIGLVAWCALRWRAIDIPFGVAVIAGLLVSPHTLIYDYTIMLLPVAIALRQRAASRRALMLLMAASYVAVTVGYRLAFYAPLQLSVVAACALMGWIVLSGARAEADAGNESGREPETGAEERILPTGA